eukprot:TRINITY_DN10243_c0_g2_i15.p1 TRINITY_DN10243_c0_g2~~TRINITY_DN10243_c0_g2_i15.p1  ORF type:complete len:336 (+),score=65.17 TRINITY_DN10243_c0_g2_i15:1926-2933(+)
MMTVVLCIVGAGQVAKLNTSFQKPFFTLFLNYGFYSLTLPVYIVLRSIFSFSFFGYRSLEKDFSTHHSYSFLKFCLVCIPVGYLSIAGYGLFWFGLTKTSLGAVMTLMNLTPIFVYILSVFFIGDHISFLRIVAVAMTIGGAISITVEDMSNSSGNVGGDLAIVASSFIWAVVNILIKECVQNCVSAPYMLLTIWGIQSLLTTWPLFFILDATGVEPYEIPTGATLGLCFAISVMSWGDLSFGFTAIALTGPLFVSVSLSLSTPLAFLLDVFVNHVTPNTIKIIAIVIMIVGYILLNVSYAGTKVGPDCYPCGNGILGYFQEQFTIIQDDVELKK